jgi:hypothetical protein
MAGPLAGLGQPHPQHCAARPPHTHSAWNAAAHHANVLASLAEDAAVNAAAAVTTAVAVETAAKPDGGPFGFLAEFFESVLKVCRCRDGADSGAGGTARPAAC